MSFQVFFVFFFKITFNSSLPEYGVINSRHCILSQATWHCFG